MRSYPERSARPHGVARQSEHVLAFQAEPTRERRRARRRRIGRVRARCAGEGTKPRAEPGERVADQHAQVSARGPRNEKRDRHACPVRDRHGEREMPEDRVHVLAPRETARRARLTHRARHRRRGGPGSRGAVPNGDIDPARRGVPRSPPARARFPRARSTAPQSPRPRATVPSGASRGARRGTVQRTARRAPGRRRPRCTPSPPLAAEREGARGGPIRATSAARDGGSYRLATCDHVSCQGATPSMLRQPRWCSAALARARCDAGTYRSMSAEQRTNGSP